MKEHQHIEWKSTWRDEYLKWICGFANADGGTLVIGRNDRGDAVGLKNAAKLLEDLPNEAHETPVKTPVETRVESSVKTSVKILELFQATPDMTMADLDARPGKTLRAKVGDRVGEKVGEGLTGNQRRILALLRQNSRLAARELAQHIGISNRKIEQNIAKAQGVGAPATHRAGQGRPLESDGGRG